MSSTYSNSLRIELIGSGDQPGAWGATTDGNLGYILDTAIAGYQTVSVTTANQALTYINGPTSTAALNQSVYALLRFTTTTTAAFSVYAPPVSKQYVVYNNSGYSMTIYNSTVIGNTTAAGTGVTVADGKKLLVFSDGTNFYSVDAASLTSTLGIANGGTGQTTANAAFNALAPSQATANGKYLKSNGTDTAWDQIDISTGDITGTLPVANGGTGATSFTSGALLKGAGSGAVTVASAADIVGQIGTTAVTNATNATNATTATTATSATSATTATTATYVTTSNSYMLATDSGGTAKTMTAVLQPGTWQLSVDGRFGISDSSSTYSFSSSQSASVSGGATASASVSVSFSRQGGSGYGRVIHGSGIGIASITVSSTPATVTFTLNAPSLGGGYYEGGAAHLNKIA